MKPERRLSAQQSVARWQEVGAERWPGSRVLLIVGVTLCEDLNGDQKANTSNSGNRPARVAAGALSVHLTSARCR